MYCKFCGKDVGNAAWCPYCGAKQTEDGAQSGAQSGHTENQNAWGEQIDLSTPAPRTNGFAVAGLILAFFSPLLGIIFSIIGMTKAREFGSGKGIAIAGIIVSVFSFIISLIATFAALPMLEEILRQAGYTLT